MIIDLRKLNMQKRMEINEDINFDETFYNNIVDGVTDVHFNGVIYYDDLNNIIVKGECSGNLILKDAITLESINKPFNIEINEEFSEIADFRLDILAILWENIVLEVPISYKSEKNSNVSLSGDGWSLNNKE